MPNMSKQYQLILGTFIDNEFIWHDVDSFDTLEEGYKEFKKYVNSQLKYTDEELVKVWNSGRLDIELRRGNRLLNWVGIYVREVDKLSEDEEEKADKENPEKKSTRDAFQASHKQYEAGKKELAELVFAEADKLPKYVNAIEYYRDIDIPKSALTGIEEFKKYIDRNFDLWDIYNTLEFLEDEGREFLKEKKGAKDSVPKLNPIYEADIRAIVPDAHGELRPVNFTVKYEDDRTHSNPEDYLYKLASKRVESYFKYDPDVKITGTFTCDGEDLNGEDYQAVKQFGKIMWIPIEDATKSKFKDSDANFDHLIEWDTNEEWLNQLSPEDQEKLFTLGLNVKRHLTFHAFPETVRVNKDKNIVFPYNVPFDKWLKEKCTFFEGEW